MSNEMPGRPGWFGPYYEEGQQVYKFVRDGVVTVYSDAEFRKRAGDEEIERLELEGTELTDWAFVVFGYNTPFIGNKCAVQRFLEYYFRKELRKYGVNLKTVPYLYHHTGTDRILDTIEEMEGFFKRACAHPIIFVVSDVAPDNFQARKACDAFIPAYQDYAFIFKVDGEDFSQFLTDRHLDVLEAWIEEFALDFHKKLSQLEDAAKVKQPIVFKEDTLFYKAEKLLHEKRRLVPRPLTNEEKAQQARWRKEEELKLLIKAKEEASAKRVAIINQAMATCLDAPKSICENDYARVMYSEVLLNIISMGFMKPEEDKALLDLLLFVGNTKDSNGRHYSNLLYSHCIRSQYIENVLRLKCNPETAVHFEWNNAMLELYKSLFRFFHLTITDYRPIWHLYVVILWTSLKDILLMKVNAARWHVFGEDTRRELMDIITEVEGRINSDPMLKKSNEKKFVPRFQLDADMDLPIANANRRADDFVFNGRASTSNSSAF